MMVRARRVRAVVACARNDDCCSPNPKRKDQGAIKGKLSHNVNKTITHFFNVVQNENMSPMTVIQDDNDLDDVDKEEFTVLTDLVLENLKDKSLPSTPHRIELHDDLKQIKVEPPVTAEAKDLNDVESLLLYGQIATATAVKLENGNNATDVDIKEPVVPVAKKNSSIKSETVGKTASKARRRLNNNQTSNQQNVLKATQVPIAKTDPENKSNHKLTDFFPVRRSVRKTKKIVLEEQQRTIEEKLNLACEDGLVVHNFQGKGRGIVASRAFCKGEFVVEYAGDLIDMQEARERELKYAQDQNTGCYMYYFKHKNTQYCIDATAETGRLGRLVNHSRNGNLNTRVIEVNRKPRLVLIAKDTVEIGDEVTYDYGDRSKESLKHHPWLAY